MMPYKNRSIDPNRVVRVYRNLNKTKDGSKWYSVTQHHKDVWLVVAHVKELMLVNARFYVSQKGRERVLREKKKNIHAYVIGTISLSGAMGRGPEDGLHIKAEYNPYKSPYFTTKDFIPQCNLGGALAVCLNQQGMSVAYFDKVNL